MAGIQDIPIRIPDDYPAFRRWFPRFITDYLAPLDVRNAVGSGVTVTSDGNSVASLDATEELAAHVAEANPHSQYALATDLADYAQQAAAETVSGAWTFSYPPVTTATTVAGLPSAATAGAGARAFVTDATSTTFNAAAAGGGANKVPVFSDGASWKVG